ncbi:SLC13 family permease [Psychromarinibacter sp. S121]|uniref:SLC13 family permease n=1 Tax=Psychromarinibacter sp. S121 TaxID=3415127 RepID=UPI003C7E5006
MFDLIAGHEAVIALGLLVLLFAAFVAELYPPEVTATAGAAVFIVMGFVPAREVSAAFSNGAPLTIAAMFVISGALVRTGLLDALAQMIVSRAEQRPIQTLALFFGSTMVASAFVNNTPVVLILIPVVIKLAQARHSPSTKYLIPLSYAAILGGTCTLIGTSTNLLVNGVAQDAGMDGFGIFEIAPVGLVTAAAGMGFMLFAGRFLLPARDDAGVIDDKMDGSPFLTEVTVADESPYEGVQLSEVAPLNRPGIRITGLRRGGRIRRGDLSEEVLQVGDALIVVSHMAEVLTLHETKGLRVGLRRNPPNQARRADDAKLVRVEAIVTPARAAVGARLSELGLGSRYGIRLLSVHRPHHVAGADLNSVRLRAADRLLMEGPPESFDQLAQKGDVVAITRTSGRAYRRRQAPLALLALILVVALSAIGMADILIAALLAVAAMLVLRCIDNDEAWDSIDAGILVLIFAMLIVGKGLELTGAVELVVGAIAPLLQNLPPWLVLAVVYATASVLTETVTNNAVAVVLTPVVIALSAQLGYDPRSMVMAVMMGASASFATPIGYQTNTLVYGAGNYRFADFLKVGVPMNIVAGIAAVIAISIFFPLSQ